MNIVIIAIVLGILLGIIAAKNDEFLFHYLVGWSIAFISIAVIRYV